MFSLFVFFLQKKIKFLKFKTIVVSQHLAWKKIIIIQIEIIAYI